jgi:hypothetical protein
MHRTKSKDKPPEWAAPFVGTQQFPSASHSFLYRCLNTGDNVPAWAADDPEDDDPTYVQVTCLACAQTHLVNTKTGKVLGSGDVDAPNFCAVTHRALQSDGERAAELFG